jgi:hypothetical protein
LYIGSDDHNPEVLVPILDVFRVSRPPMPGMVRSRKTTAGREAFSQSGQGVFTCGSFADGSPGFLEKALYGHPGYQGIVDNEDSVFHGSTIR